jgi:hypothetical protein
MGTMDAPETTPSGVNVVVEPLREKETNISTYGKVPNTGGT